MIINFIANNCQQNILLGRRTRVRFGPFSEPDFRN